MVYDSTGRLYAHAAHRLHDLGIHDDHVVHPTLGQVVQMDERQHVAVIGEKGLQVAVELARQNRHGLGVQPGRRQHAGEGVEVRVLVGQNQGLGKCRSWHS